MLGLWCAGRLPLAIESDQESRASASKKMVSSFINECWFSEKTVSMTTSLLSGEDFGKLVQTLLILFEAWLLEESLKFLHTGWSYPITSITTSGFCLAKLISEESSEAIGRLIRMAKAQRARVRKIKV